MNQARLQARTLQTRSEHSGLTPDSGRTGGCRSPLPRQPPCARRLTRPSARVTSPHPQGSSVRKTVSTHHRPGEGTATGSLPAGVQVHSARAHGAHEQVMWKGPPAGAQGTARAPRGSPAPHGGPTEPSNQGPLRESPFRPEEIASSSPRRVARSPAQSRCATNDCEMKGCHRRT